MESPTSLKIFSKRSLSSLSTASSSGEISGGSPSSSGPKRSSEGSSNLWSAHILIVPVLRDGDVLVDLQLGHSVGSSQNVLVLFAVGCLSLRSYGPQNINRKRVTRRGQYSSMSLASSRSLDAGLAPSIKRNMPVAYMLSPLLQVTIRHVFQGALHAMKDPCQTKRTSSGRSRHRWTPRAKPSHNHGGHVEDPAGEAIPVVPISNLGMPMS